MAGDLSDLRKQLASCLRDLELAPEHKRGSEWWEDRRLERDWLRRAIARLEQSRGN